MSDTAVWFDLDGTLCHHERPFDRLVADALVAAGARSPPDGAYDVCAERIFSTLEACESEPYAQAFDQVATVLEVDVDPAEAAAAYRELEREATTVTETARDVLAAVGSRAPVGVLTNGDGPHERAKLADHGLDEILDAVVVSNEVGVRKPDPELFAVAEDRLDAGRHVHVADEFETDVLPAQQAGWDAVHVRNDDGPAASVNDLGALGTLLL